MTKIHKTKLGPWLVWSLSALFGLYTFLLQGTPSVMIPQLMPAYAIDVIRIGILTSGFFYTYIVMQVPAGMLIDLWGPRRVLKVGFFCCSLAVAWFAFSNHFWEGQTSRMIMGVATSPAIIAAFCLASRWFKPHLFTLLVALTEFLALGGGVLGEGGLAKLVMGIGWRYTMFSVAVVGLLLTVLSFFIIHDHPEHYQPLYPGISFKESLKNTRKNVVKILLIKQVWLNGIYGGLVFGLFPAFAALWAIPYLMNRFQISVDLSALVASTFFFGACLGTLALGWISIYIAKKRPIMLIGSAISFLLLLIALYSPFINLKMMFLLFFLMGFFCSSYAICFTFIASYMTPSTKGLGMGFANMLCIIFGAPIYQPLIGALLKWHATSETLGLLKKYNLFDYEVALSILPLSLLLSFFLAFFIKEPSSHKPAVSH